MPDLKVIDPPDTDSLTKEHSEPIDQLSPYYREASLQEEGAEPVPLLVWITIFGVLLFGIFYLGMNVGDFSSYPWLQHPDDAEITPVGPENEVTVDGAQIYMARCASCHQLDGTGVSGAFPPLNNSEWVTGDAGRLIRVVLNGMTGAIEVNGEVYNGFMPPWGNQLSNAEIAAVATFIRSEWDNEGSPVSPEEVEAVRQVTDRSDTWTAELLNRPEHQGIPGISTGVDVGPTAGSDSVATTK